MRLPLQLVRSLRKMARAAGSDRGRGGAAVPGPDRRARTAAAGLGFGVLLLALAAWAPVGAAQQPPSGEAAPAVQPVVEAAAEADRPSADASDPLPAPRMDRAYGHVFLAFGIAWALMFGYVWALNRRIAAAERDLERLIERGG